MFYVPVEALEAGPGKISRDAEDSRGFWVGTLSCGDRSVKVTGFENGGLKGLVKIPADSLGGSPSTRLLVLLEC
jgi:hypothetical protein